MAAEPREPDDWEVLQSYGSASEAEIHAGYLKSEGVAAKVRPLGDIPGTENGAQLIVDSTLVHRARWLLKFDSVSDAELEYLATGSLAPVQDSIPETKRSNMSGWIIAAALILAALLAIAHIAGNVAI